MNEASEDPYELLGIDPAFTIDKANLRATVRRRVAASHPDRVTDPVQQAEAVRESARVNAAGAVLEDDELRANALLARLGGPSADEDKSLPESFLARMLEIRMDMEAVMATGDAEGRRRLEAWADAERTGLVESVASLFVRLQAGEAVGGELRQQLNVWRYIERMIEQLDDPDPGATG